MQIDRIKLRLSTLNPWIGALLGLFFGVVGYIYTAQFKRLAIAVMLYFAVVLLSIFGFQHPGYMGIDDGLIDNTFSLIQIAFNISCSVDVYRQIVFAKEGGL